MQKTLTSKRLILRPLSPDDAAPMAKALNNLEITRWVAVIPHPYSLQDANDFIGKCQATDTLGFAITHEGHFIGCIGTNVQLGYWLAQPFWGQGIMSEAARAVVQDYFDASSKDDLKSGYFIGNTASQALLAKLGFRNTDKGTTACRATGKTVALQHMVLDRDTWDALT